MRRRLKWPTLIASLFAGGMMAYVIALTLIAGRARDLWMLVVFLAAIALLFSAGWAMLRGRKYQLAAGRVLDQLEQAILLNLPLPRAMAALAEDMDGALSTGRSSIPADLAAGQPLGTTLAKHTSVSPDAIKAISAAERAGQLDRVVPALAEQRRAATADRVRNGDFYRHYPLVVLIVLLLIVQVFRIFVGPKFEQIFRDFRQPLPWITQVTISGGRDFVDTILLAAFLILIVAWLWRTVRATQAASERMSIPKRLMQRLPLIGRAHLDDAWAQSLTYIADSMEDQRNFSATLQLASELTGHSRVRAALLAWDAGLSRGEPLQQAARDAKVPRLLTALVGNEQDAGLVDELRFAADHLRQHAAELRAWWRLALAPAVALSLGMLVAWVALSMMLPMVRLIDATNTRALVVR